MAPIGRTHGCHGFLHDPGGAAPPTGVNGADGLMNGIVQQHGAAVGGKDRQGQTGDVGDESIHICVVPGTEQTLPGVLCRDGADIGGVGLLTQHRFGFVQFQNGEKAMVIFPQLFRAVPLSGAEVQAVPRGGGHASPPGGKAVGDLIQNIGGEPHQTGLLMLLKGHS